MKRERREKVSKLYRDSYRFSYTLTAPPDIMLQFGSSLKDLFDLDDL